MRVRLVGDNARYLEQHWAENGMVEISEDEESVEVYPKPNSSGANALYDCYLKCMRAEAKAVSVWLMLEDSTPLTYERSLRGG